MNKHAPTYTGYISNAQPGPTGTTIVSDDRKDAFAYNVARSIESRVAHYDGDVEVEVHVVITTRKQ